ncbi:MAG: DUF2911 domain-containing protein [Cellulophaga sp.]
MKKVMLLIAIVLFIGCKEEKSKKTETVQEHEMPAAAKETKKKKKVLSPHTETMAMVGDAHIHIDYSSPGVRERIIFGGLLPNNKVWQAGAHKATWIETNKDLTIQGKLLKAGKYGFFVIPSTEEWTLILNTNWDQHGKDDYDEKEDVMRFSVQPIILEDTIEHLEYKITKTAMNEGEISMAWEKVKVSFAFRVN